MCRTAGVTCKANGCVPLWQLASTTGLPRAELCGLRWADGDFEKARLHVSRTVIEVRGHLVVQDDGKTEAVERSFALMPARWTRCVPGGPGRPRSAWPHAGRVDRHRVRVHPRGRKRLPAQAAVVSLRRGGPCRSAADRHPWLAPHVRDRSARAGVSPEVVSKRLGHSSVVIDLTVYACLRSQD